MHGQQNIVLRSLNLNILDTAVNWLLGHPVQVSQIINYGLRAPTY